MSCANGGATSIGSTNVLIRLTLGAMIGRDDSIEWPIVATTIGEV